MVVFGGGGRRTPGEIARAFVLSVVDAAAAAIISITDATAADTASSTTLPQFVLPR